MKAKKILFQVLGIFGNAHNYKNVIKSVLIDDFNAQGMLMTNKTLMEHLFTNATYFAIDNSWTHFAKMASQMVVDGFKNKDF